MGLYVIADLHLPFAVNKPMDIFGGWENYVDRIRENWLKEITDSDTVVIPGDISWAMRLEAAVPDFEFINSLPGKKIISKGNHDYWWSSLSKINGFLKAHGFDSIYILHNNHYEYEGFGICGTRGWINDSSEPADAKVLAREEGRLETSISSAEKAGLVPIVFLHYPPLFADEENYGILQVLWRHKVKRCFYGHLHGNAHKFSVNGVRDGVEYTLISADYLNFAPYRVC